MRAAYQNPARRDLFGRARPGGPGTRAHGACGLLLAGLFWAPLAPAAPADAASASGDMDARLDLLFGEHAPYRAFLQQLQGAVAADERQRVATLVSYPLKVKLDGQVVHLRTAQQFLSHYDELLPPATRALIAAQSYEQLFVNGDGVMIGSGQLWFSGVCNDERCGRRIVKIIAFNPGG